MLEVVDVVVATAESLTRSKVPRSGRTHYLPQGVNYEHFNAPRPEPPDLADIPRPRIGFSGQLSACCDLTLLRHVAVAFPRASLVFVGPVSVDPVTLNLPNVHFLGRRAYDQLPAYVQHFDVGIVPYLLNEWTVAVDPLKVLEYLAAGIPVVSTKIPELEKYRDAVLVAEDQEGFVRGVRRALAEDKSVARRRGEMIASRNTWEQRAERLLTILDQAAADTKLRGEKSDE
ncbi:MAG: glycosyltransferase [Planctomycetes bacterium]|nr:glycosyltransferase [Planctomycetota bacterium]